MDWEERIGALKHVTEAVLLSRSKAEVLALQLLLDLCVQSLIYISAAFLEFDGSFFINLFRTQATLSGKQKRQLQEKLDYVHEVVKSKKVTCFWFALTWSTHKPAYFNSVYFKPEKALRRIPSAKCQRAGHGPLGPELIAFSELMQDRRSVAQVFASCPFEHSRLYCDKTESTHKSILGILYTSDLSTVTLTCYRILMY